MIELLQRSPAEEIKLLPPGGVRRQDFSWEPLGQNNYDTVARTNQCCELINEDGRRCGERAIQALNYDCHAHGDSIFLCGKHDLDKLSQKIMDEAASSNWFTRTGINGWGRSY